MGFNGNAVPDATGTEVMGFVDLLLAADDLFYLLLHLLLLSFHITNLIISCYLYMAIINNHEETYLSN